jgi:hypothetical protein
MSVQQLPSHLGECRRRLADLRGRQDYLALSCAILRVEGAGGTVLHDRPFARVLNERPFHDYLAISHGETFAVAFYPVAAGIQVDRIPAALAAVEAITGEIQPLLRELPRPIRDTLKLPESDNWWREVFHLAWHFPRPFLRATRRRWLAKNGAPSGVSDETFVQMYGTGGRSDLLPGLIYSDLEHDLCTCSEAAIAIIIEALERSVQTRLPAPLEAQGLSADQRRTFDHLRAEFLAGTQLPTSLECKLPKLADSFDTPPAIEWAGLQVGGCVERFLTLSRLNDMQEIAQVRGPATGWFCELAERAGNALPLFVLDLPVLFDDIRRGCGGPRPVISRGPLERWIGFVFTVLKKHEHVALQIRWETQMGPLSHGLATLDRDLFAASVLVIDLAKLTTAAEEASNRERATCSPFTVPSMEEQGVQWAEKIPPPPAPPEHYTLGDLLHDLRQFGESYQKTEEQIREQHPVVQRGQRIQLGAFVSHTRDSLQRITGFKELRDLARSLWGEEISFAVGQRIVEALVERSNGRMSPSDTEGLKLVEVAAMLTPGHGGEELPAPTDGESRKQVVEALKTWKRVLYPHMPGGPLPLPELVALTNKLVAWRDRHASRFDISPLDDVRRILLQRDAGETTPEEELRTAGERAARACDRIKDWLQTLEDFVGVKTAGYRPSTELSRLVFELNNPPSDLPAKPGELEEVPNPFDDARRPWLPILKEYIGKIPDLGGELTEAILRQWLWRKYKVPPTHDLNAEQLVPLLERELAENVESQKTRAPADTPGSHAASSQPPTNALKTPLEIFISFSNKDDGMRVKLEAHLSLFKHQGLIAAWHYRQITAGTEWEGQIDGHLNSSHIILLLISTNFLASRYCYDVEMTRALERHAAGEARVVPIIIRQCDWHTAPFGKLQALPKDAKPVPDWKNHDAAFTDVARGIRAVVAELTAQP